LKKKKEKKPNQSRRWSQRSSGAANAVAEKVQGHEKTEACHRLRKKVNDEKNQLQSNKVLPIPIRMVSREKKGKGVPKIGCKEGRSKVSRKIGTVERGGEDKGNRKSTWN